MRKNVFFCLLILLFTSASFAGTSTWIAAGGGSWTNAANWDVPPVNGDRVVFNFSGGGTVTVTDVPSITLERLTVNNTGNTTLLLTATSAVAIGIDDPANDVATNDIVVAATATLTIGSNVTLSTVSGSDVRGNISGTLNIGSGAVLNMGSTEAIIAGSGTFNNNSGGSMIIGSASGITSSGATGNIQTTTRTFNTGANYIYAATGAMSTGNGLPATVDNLSIVATGTEVTLLQNLTISGTLNLFSGAFVISGRTLTLNGALTGTSGTLTGGSTTGLVIGGSGSLLTIPAIAGNLGTLTVNRVAGVMLGANLLVDGPLSLTSGILNTGAFVLTHGLTAQQNILQSSGYVQGTLSRYLDAITGSKSFPMGSSGYYRSLSFNFTAAPTTPGHVTVSHIDGAESVPLSPSLDDAGYTVNRRSRMYFTISYGAFAGGIWNITLDARGLPGVNNSSLLRTVRSTDNGVTFDLVGTHRANSGLYASRTGVTGNMPGNYYFASQEADNPLPVTLSFFKLQSANQQVLLSWRTAMEVNNAGFEILRSTDATTFEQVASYKTNSELTGMGQSNFGKDYRYTDNTSLQYGQTYYYKLVDVSMDGVRKEYPVKWIKLAEPGSFTRNVRLNTIAPNPVVNTLRYSFQLKTDNYVSVELYTQAGQLVATPIQHQLNKAGTYNSEFVISKLPAGTYIMNIKTSAGNDLKRFVIAAN